MNVAQLVEVLPREGKWSWLSKRVDTMLSKGQLLVFVNSIESAEELEQNFVDFLDKNAGNVHDGLDAQECLRIVLEFQKGELDILVATDIAAVFGLDKSSSITVVSYDPPRDILAHTNRIGFAIGTGGAVESYTLLHDDDGHQGMAALLVEHFKQINQPISHALWALAERGRPRRRGSAPGADRAVKFLKSDTPQVSQSQVLVGGKVPEEVDSDEDLFAPGVRSAFAPELRQHVDSKSRSQRARRSTAVPYNEAVQSHTQEHRFPSLVQQAAPEGQTVNHQFPNALQQGQTLDHRFPNPVQQAVAEGLTSAHRFPNAVQLSAADQLSAHTLALAAEQCKQIPTVPMSANTLAPVADQLRPGTAPSIAVPMEQHIQGGMQTPLVQTSSNALPQQLLDAASSWNFPTSGQLNIPGSVQVPLVQMPATSLLPATAVQPRPDTAPLPGLPMQQMAASGSMQQPLTETAANGSAPETLADQAATGQQGANGAPPANRQHDVREGVAPAGRTTTSAGWSRFKEDEKYKIAADTNVNPKHVGGSLRTLTMEDRLELRRKSRALAKTGAIAGGEIEDTFKGQVVESATKTFEVTKDHGEISLEEIADDEDDVVVGIGGPSCLTGHHTGGRSQQGASGNVDLTIIENATADWRSRSSAKPLEVLDVAVSAVDASSGINNVVERIEDLEGIIQLDEDASDGAAARRAQRKRRKADAFTDEAARPAQVQHV